MDAWMVSSKETPFEVTIMKCPRLLASLIAITVLLFFCIEEAAARYDPYLSDPNTSFFGRLIIQNDELNTAGSELTGDLKTALLEAAEQSFDLRGSRPTPTNRVSLQPPNLPTASGSGTNLSRDGSCAVGYQDAGFSTPFHALRWTQATGPLDLGTLDPNNNSTRSSFATDANQDCSVVVGVSDVTVNGATQHAFRWTSAGMLDLGAPANGGPNSRAFGVSSNGSVIVGDADFPDPNNLISGKSRKAFRWTQASGFQNLGDLQPAGLSIASAVTGDGTVVVGGASTNSGSSAFRWVVPTPPAQPVLQSIGPLPGHTHAVATGVSDNGKIVVGTSSTFPLTRNNVGFDKGAGAFRWTQAGGLQDLKQILSSNGVDMTGIALVSVTGMSPDGQWIQGAATTSQTGPGETVAYIAQVCDDDIGSPCLNTVATPFTLGASPTQLMVAAGQSGSTTITVTPDAGFNQPVSFSCGNLPVGAACSFNPATVTPAGGPINTILTIATNGGPVAMISPGGSPSMFAFVLTPFVLMLVGLFLYRPSVDHHNLWTGMLLMLVIATANCSSSDSSAPPPNGSGGIPAAGTPAGSSNVTVTASSASGNSTVPITLNVTR